MLQLDDRARPLIDTPKVTVLQMLVCVGAGDISSSSSLPPLFLTRLLSIRIFYVGLDDSVPQKLYITQARGCSQA